MTAIHDGMNGLTEGIGVSPQYLEIVLQKRMADC